MAVVVKTVSKNANQDATLDIGVGKKLYGVLMKYGTDVFLNQNGLVIRLLDKSVIEYYFPVPLDPAASSSLVFKGSMAGTIGVIVDE